MERRTYHAVIIFEKTQRFRDASRWILKKKPVESFSRHPPPVVVVFLLASLIAVFARENVTFRRLSRRNIDQSPPNGMRKCIIFLTSITPGNWRLYYTTSEASGTFVPRNLERKLLFSGLQTCIIFWCQSPLGIDDSAGPWGDTFWSSFGRNSPLGIDNLAGQCGAQFVILCTSITPGNRRSGLVRSFRLFRLFWIDETGETNTPSQIANS